MLQKVKKMKNFTLIKGTLINKKVARYLNFK